MKHRHRPLNENGSPLELHTKREWERLSKRNKSKIECNLCGKSFQPRNKYERFCQECKDENEAYLFDEVI